MVTNSQNIIFIASYDVEAHTCVTANILRYEYNVQMEAYMNTSNRKYIQNPTTSEHFTHVYVRSICANNLYQNNKSTGDTNKVGNAISSLMKILLVIRCTYNRTAPNNPILDLITVMNGRLEKNHGLLRSVTLRLSTSRFLAVNRPRFLTAVMTAVR